MNRILIIDDHDEFRKMLKLTLEQAGYVVVQAANGKEGLASYQKDQIDLVITDIFMPEKDGIETILELKKINPDIKIIAVSGGGIGHKSLFLDTVKDFGVQKTFEKPFDSEELLTAIKDLLCAD